MDEWRGLNTMVEVAGAVYQVSTSFDDSRPIFMGGPYWETIVFRSDEAGEVTDFESLHTERTGASYEEAEELHQRVVTQLQNGELKLSESE